MLAADCASQLFPWLSIVACLCSSCHLLFAQLQGAKWTWQALNTLCWAVGSISGAMQEDQENRFLVTVIR
jgi:hypothetical protein